MRAAAPALAGYVAARALGLVVLWIMARHFGEHVPSLLGRFDGRWFIDIAEHGYDTSLTHRANGSLVNTNVVFFPGYPYLIDAVSAVTGLSVLWAGIVTSWLAGIAAAWGIFAVGDLVYGRRTGVVLAVLWGIQTHAIVESMVYSESLFTALCAWSLYALLRRQWLTAGTLCLLAGTTRAAAGVLVAVVVVAAVIARREGWRPWVAALLAPLGLLAYLAWVGHALHRWDGWFYMQDKGWHLHFDGGWATLHTLADKVLLEATALELYEVTAVAARIGRPACSARVPSSAVAVARVRGRTARAHDRRRRLLPREGSLPATGVPASAAGRGCARTRAAARGRSRSARARARLRVVRRLPVAAVDRFVLTDAGLGREPEREARAARSAAHGDGAAHRARELVDDRQARPVPTGRVPE